MVLDRLSPKDIERLSARIEARRGESDSTLRPWVARELFDRWSETTNPELLSAQWNSLNGEDRMFWLGQADRLLVRFRRGV